MFSNPFTLGLAVDYHAGGLAAADGVTETPRQTAVRWFCEWLDGRLSHDERKPPRRHDIIRALKGKNLACWCPRGKACHADVLLEIANGPERALPAAGME